MTYWGALTDYATGEVIRPATEDEWKRTRDMVLSGSAGGESGAWEDDDGRTVWVDGGPDLGWIARVGEGNAAWLTGPNSPLSGNHVYAEDNGDGTVALGTRAYFILAGLAEYEDGYTERTGTGESRMWIMGDSFPVERGAGA